MESATSVTFVCCVESGPLEDQTTRLAKSLRRFGGAFSRAPLLAVQARSGPGLARSTLEAFDELDVAFARIPGQSGLSWNKFFNKPLALEWASRQADSRLLCWLDSDMLVVGQPDAFVLPPETGFAACAPDKNLGSSGPSDPNEPYWRAVCEALGLDIESLPMVVTQAEGQAIRFYFNSGAFVFERAGPLAKTFLRTCLDLLRARIASRHAGIFFLDQVALGLSVIRAGLSWTELPLSHNHTLGSKAPRNLAEPALVSEARILHYHDALWPPQWPGLLDLLGQALPEVRAWLEPQGPMTNPAGTAARLGSKLVNALRGVRQKRYERECRHV